MAERVHTLVVDDEQGVRFFLAETLRRADHVAVTASSGAEALDHLRDTRFELVVLDLRLGGTVDGMRVLEAVKWRWPETAVVILTAHGSLESAVAAIREGVDGYLLKPVEPDEVRRAMREALDRRRMLARSRERGKEEHILQQGPFSIDVDKHVATLDGQPLRLTPQEFRLLMHLMQNSHRVISPNELVRVVRQYECEDLFEARQITKWYIHRLRRKVEPDPTSPRYILTVRGVGYRFAG
jgi:DNA-binding response OmpR family regulator